jgi:histidine triad (HIT) family protein
MPEEYLPEDRRKHLDLVQAVVVRMASASSSTKGWLLPVVAATYGYALVQHSWTVGLLGVAAVAVFAVLDAHYLRQERAFRVLFREVAAGRVRDYKMDVHPYVGKPNRDEEDLRERNCTWPAVAKSWALGAFYGPLGVVGVVVVVVAAAFN